MELRPLNIFQKVMRIWEEAHPYNAAQVMHLEGEPDLQRITDAWNETLASSGLGIVRVSGQRFRYEKAPRQELTVVDAGIGLEAHVTSELNRPFWEGEVSRRGTFAAVPFRPFVVRANGSHYLGAIYQHWVADSIAMRMLLREWFCRLYDPASATRKPLHLPQGGFWRYFGPHRGAGWHPVEGAITALESMTQFSSARRIDEPEGAQQVKCTLHRLPEGMINDLVECARRRRKVGTTFNDLLLTALARTCNEYGASPRHSNKDMALGTIVDLRATSHENLDNTFGMFLGFMALVVRGALLHDRERLLASIAAQNAHHKEKRAAQVSMLRMAAGYMQGRFLSQQQLAAFYRNYMPLSGGVSNVNMNRSWPAEYHPSPLLDYIRVAPTGPMVPVVIGATTIGRRFTFVLTSRTSLVDEWRGRQFAQMFIDELTALAKTG